MTHKNNNIILGLDTSCYTTSIAAITLDKEVILNEKIILKVKKDCKVNLLAIADRTVNRLPFFISAHGAVNDILCN